MGDGGTPQSVTAEKYIKILVNIVYQKSMFHDLILKNQPNCHIAYFKKHLAI